MTRNVRKPIEDYRLFTAKDPVNDNQERLVFVAKDAVIIKQYYELRNKVFREEWGLTHEKWSKTDHDGNSEIMVCMINGEVVGGLRVLISSNGELLSEEYEGTEFIYENLMKKVGVSSKGKKYAEFVDLIVHKDFRDGSVARNLISSCIEYVRSYGCSYVFYLASLSYCRLYRAIFLACNCKSVRIFQNIIWNKTSEYNYSEDHPALVIL